MSLKREGYYISLDKRRGAVIALDIDKLEQLEEMRRELRIVLAPRVLKNISRQEVHDLVDEIFDDYSARMEGVERSLYRVQFIMYLYNSYICNGRKICPDK